MAYNAESKVECGVIYIANDEDFQSLLEDVDQWVMANISPAQKATFKNIVHKPLSSW